MATTEETFAELSAKLLACCEGEVHHIQDTLRLVCAKTTAIELLSDDDEVAPAAAAFASPHPPPPPPRRLTTCVVFDTEPLDDFDSDSRGGWSGGRGGGLPTFNLII